MAKWYLKRRGEEQENGPLGDRELKALAESGGVTPEDFVRKDGMDGWVPASKVKGLFVVDTGTGPVVLIPQKKKTETKPPASSNPPTSPPPASRPPASPAATAPAPSPKPKPTTAPGKKPTATPKTPAPPAPSTRTTPPQGNVSAAPAANPFGLGSQTPAADPFGLGSQTPAADPFGLGSQTPAADPFGLGSQTPAADPFGLATPAADPFSANPNDLAALSQVAASSAVVVTAPFAEPDDEPMRRSAGGGDNSKKLWLVMPFLCAIPITMGIAAVNAFMPVCLCFVSFMILGGLGKILGMVNGKGIKEAGIRHDNFSYMYGGAVGVFACYFLWVTYFLVQGNIFSAMLRTTVGEVNPILMAEMEGVDTWAEDPEAMASGDESLAEDADDFEEFDFTEEERANFRQAMENGGDMLMSPNGVTLGMALSPFCILKYIRFRVVFGAKWVILIWLVEIGTLVSACAQSTWMAVHKK